MHIRAVFRRVREGGGVDQEEKSEGELEVFEEEVSQGKCRLKGFSLSLSSFMKMMGDESVLERRLGRRLLFGCWGC